MIITILKDKNLKTACDHLDFIFSLQANSECSASNQQTDASFVLSVYPHIKDKIVSKHC